MKKEIIQKGIIFLLIMTLSVNNSKSQNNFIWGLQSGTDKEEYVLNHVKDSDGNIYVSGKTTGLISGLNSGKNDGFLTKFDSLGNSLWTSHFGTAEDEDILWSAIDKSGNVYITGSTIGTLAEKSFGKQDVFVVKYNTTGQLIWAKQFGTDSIDIGSGIYSDSKGYVYVTGSTQGIIGKSSFGKTDGFIIKLDAKGNTIFINQFGTPGDDNCIAITGDMNSRIYVCGSTWGDIAAKNRGMVDAFTGSFTENGKLIKMTQFGSDGFDMALQLTVDDKENIYIGGSTSGNLAGNQLGDGDCFLAKINNKGEIIWTNQFGTKRHDGVRGIVFNKKISDNILVSGIMNLAPSFSFIRMYKDDGSLLWERCFSAKGKQAGTSGKDISMDDNGNIYHLGLTGTNMFGPLIGEYDYYLVKLGLERIYMNR
jgi:hypothetical protein